ncbi:hypothetical protein AVEN_212484-1 [Araneus ventricosus]|uniref:Uncharacterized protein n=1 Tax=Araneus ventricosus TaxID=182803 RepID=A0A4Y2K3H5_ARAVE|nr:hypothetical protein AVEN_212484-1 [Araneus ventricosus]
MTHAQNHKSFNRATASLCPNLTATTYCRFYCSRVNPAVETDTLHDNILGEKRQVPPLRFLWRRKNSSSETAQNHVSAPVGRPARNIASRTVHQDYSTSKLI